MTEQQFVFEGVGFVPVKFLDGWKLKTDDTETITREFKGFGKIRLKSRCQTYDEMKTYEHQIPELKKQIAAMLNTEGGVIFLGVGQNGVIKGGDYSCEDKNNLIGFLKNLTKDFGISGYGLIKDPKFHGIPHEYVSTFPNEPDSQRYLVTFEIKPSNKPIRIDKKIYVRDLGGVEEVELEIWQHRMQSNEPTTTPKQNIISGVLKPSYASVVSLADRIENQ